MAEPIVASIENMRKYAGSRNRAVYAYSPTTGEEYSADAADYWSAPDGWIMRGCDDEPMFLAVRVERPTFLSIPETELRADR